MTHKSSFVLEKSRRESLSINEMKLPTEMIIVQLLVRTLCYRYLLLG